MGDRVDRWAPAFRDCDLLLNLDGLVEWATDRDWEGEDLALSQLGPTFVLHVGLELVAH